MGMFGNRKEKEKVLTRAQFGMELKKLQEYRLLVGAMGSDAAEATIEDIYWHSTMRGTQPFFKLEQSRWQGFLDNKRSQLEKQRKRAIACKSHINWLFQEAMTGKLAKELRKPENIKLESRYGATDKDIDAVKGAKWIMDCSHSINNPHSPNSNVSITVDEVANLIIECNRKQMSVFDIKTLEFLHEGLVKGKKIERRGYLDASNPFTTSGVARFLQRAVAEKVSSLGARSKFLKDEDWDNIACFFLGAYMRSHGFSDGNGRPNRALFVLTMIQGFRPFVAPTGAFEQDNLTTNNGTGLEADVGIGPAPGQISSAFPGLYARGNRE